VVASLLDPLNALRERVGRPLLVTSGLRCPFWNTHERGEKDSEHLTGEAVDLQAGTSPERWSLLAANFAHAVPLFARIGIGRTFLHFGVSATLAPNVVWHYYPTPQPKEATT
jgi:hypothetical protein